jgi:hypothetical protein
MCWINIASTRHQVRQQVKKLIEEWEMSPESHSLGMTPGLLSLLTGDQELITRAMDLSRPVLEFFTATNDEGLGDPTVLPHLVGLSVLAYLDGEDQSKLWQRIATSKPFVNKTMHALQTTIGRLVGTHPMPTKMSEPKLGHVKSTGDWLRRLANSPTRYLFDLAISPDHGLWEYTLDSFVLPLGLLLEKELQESGDSVDPYALFHLGAYPQQYSGVIYERQHKRPAWDSVPNPEAPETWFGFDAVELCAQQVFLYHYLGLKWQAPLLFDDEVNAFQFLDQLDKSWQLVQSSLPSQQWEEVEKLKRAGQCVHIVVHDTTLAPCLPAHLERAAKHYGVVLESRDVTLV